MMDVVLTGNVLYQGGVLGKGTSLSVSDTEGKDLVARGLASKIQTKAKADDDLSAILNAAPAETVKKKSRK